MGDDLSAVIILEGKLFNEDSPASDVRKCLERLLPKFPLHHDVHIVTVILTCEAQVRVTLPDRQEAWSQLVGALGINGKAVHKFDRPHPV